LKCPVYSVVADDFLADYELVMTAYLARVFEKTGKS